MNGWENFFIAEVGASSALAGLVFVGISINLDRILKFPVLPGRALEAIVALVAVLAVSSLLLVPGQSIRMIGAELLLVGLVDWAFLGGIQVCARSHVQEQYRKEYVIRIVLTELATLPFVIGGVAVLTRGEGGIYWTVPGILISFAIALFDAWVLLIEINR